MIFNRTQEDIDKARIALSKIKKKEELTSEDLTFLERATFNVNTINRIEDKQSALKSLFNSMGYWETPVQNKQWNYVENNGVITADIFSESDFDRILSNIDILRKAFFESIDMPKTPKKSYDINTANAIEKILDEFEKIVAFVKENYAESGDVECGQR